MRKKTEELWKEAGGNSLTDYGVEWLETFRRLVIENERECAEAVGYFYVNDRGFWNQAGDPISFPSCTTLFTFPPAAIDRDSVIEALQLAHDHMRLYLSHYTEKHNVFDTVTRALKSQLAALDQRDEALRVAKGALEDVREWCLCQDSPNDKQCKEALAAIDAVMKG